MTVAEIVVAILAVVVASVVYWLMNIPIPEGFQDLWSFRMMYCFMKLKTLIFDFMVMLGYDPKDLMIAARGTRWLKQEPANCPVKLEDKTFGGVSVRMFTPEGIPETGNPGIAFYHGGGWILGSVDMYTSYCEHLAHETRSIVMSVEYRLAPEHIFPAPLDDCVTATKHFIQHAEDFGINKNRIALAGDSAGGNLAAATALRLRDEKFQPQPKLQVLIYPCLQAIDMYTPSWQSNADNAMLPKKLMTLFWILYATGETKYHDQITTNMHTTPAIKTKLARKALNHDVICNKFSAIGYEKPSDDFGDKTVWEALEPVLMDPYFAPLMAKDVTGLPEALIFTVEYDVLRDDGIWYASHLEAAKVKVTHQHYKPALHGMMVITMNKKSYNEARHLIFDEIKKRL